MKVLHILVALFISVPEITVSQSTNDEDIRFPEGSEAVDGFCLSSCIRNREVRRVYEPNFDFEQWVSKCPEACKVSSHEPFKGSSAEEMLQGYVRSTIGSTEYMLNHMKKNGIEPPTSGFDYENSCRDIDVTCQSASDAYCQLPVCRY